ncbi:hypothetical protein Bca4012_048415 [Brassica carinata]
MYLQVQCSGQWLVLRCLHSCRELEKSGKSLWCIRHKSFTKRHRGHQVRNTHTHSGLKQYKSFNKHFHCDALFSRFYFELAVDDSHNSATFVVLYF